jgi:hypothetical protein
MRQTLAAVAIIGLVALAGCKPKGGPPPAAPTPPPVAPATPPPAPEPPPSRDVAPVEDEYSRLRNMASDEIERMGATATNAAPSNTTWRWATGAPGRPWTT